MSLTARTTFDVKSDEICYRLDRLIDHYKVRLEIAGVRWDALQDVVPQDDDECDTPRGTRLWAICGRAEDRYNEMEWRIKQLKSCYDGLEEIEISIERTKNDNNHKRRMKKAETATAEATAGNDE